jgi:hypothetical protein
LIQAGQAFARLPFIKEAGMEGLLIMIGVLIFCLPFVWLSRGDDCDYSPDSSYRDNNNSPDRFAETSKATIQFQNSAGRWVFAGVVYNSSDAIITAMTAVSERNDGARVRAIDERGRVLDIL